MSSLTQIFKEQKSCRDARCSDTCYGVAKVAFWSAFFSMFIVGPRLWDCYLQARRVEESFEAFVNAGAVLWIAVWFATIALNCHEKINHFLTLLINSMSLPGFILGIALLVGAGA
ncbi:hypothetical protein [Sagittula salina]|uniref:Uncharacterized protein n=1 Tax=Sagittula salina TaxID=2820268 RepID=A0A940MU64_9RHOB|nr:hypothetical protein [Sagittula salina]MBP0484017.1 hypothetical protein [Sagittula salina]